jgi:DNA-binding CsgD family transcriptional regulator
MAQTNNRLTSRQKELCNFLLNGHTTSKELSTVMGISEQMVKNMIKDVCDRTGMGNRVELALYLERNRTLFEEPLSPGC